MVKFNSLENTKKQYPHFFDKEDDTNFTKHLKVVNNQQQEIRHNLKNVEWSRLLEKPLQIWRTQTRPYTYDINVKVNVPNIQTITVYHNPIIKNNQIISFTDKIIDEKFEYEDNAKTFEKTIQDLTVNPYETIVEETVMFDEDFLNNNSLTNHIFVESLPEPTIDDYGINYFTWNDGVYSSYTVEELPYATLYDNLTESVRPDMDLGDEWHIGFTTSTNYEGYISIGDLEEQFVLWVDGEDLYHISSEQTGDDWSMSESNSEMHEWEITFPNTNLEDYDIGDTIIIEIDVRIDNRRVAYSTDYVITPSDKEKGKLNSGMLKKIIVSNGSISDFKWYNAENKDCEFITNCIEIPYTINTDITELKHIIPNDTYLLEVTTYDDYQYWKGYPENDYSVKEDNILQYQYNTTFLDISLETISYKRYLVFRVHKNNIKTVNILKNDKIVFTQTLESWKIQDKDSTDFSHYYYGAENEGNFKQYFEIEDKESNRELAYFTKEQDEYVFYYPLSDDDLELCFHDYTDKEKYILDKENNVNASENTLGKVVIKLEDGEYNSYKTIKDDENNYSFQGLKSKLEHDYIVKDIYDLEAYTVENRYRCREDYERKYTKRYNGYDKQTNDCFDHDYSLDIIGTLLNVPRYRLYKTYREDENYLSRTYPPYYDRPTEDDYHYMKRMQEYIRQYNHTPFPVLECWKYYQLTPTLRSRKEIIGVMDETSLRYNGEDLICDSDFMKSITEEDSDEEIMSYSINKATQTKGDGLKVTRGDKTWYETVIVNNCYIVPNTSYRLRYGLDSEAEEVNIRMICYNRDGSVIRTVPVLPEYHDEPTEMYNVTNGFDYTDTILITPKDTVYIKLLLESNNPFNYSDVSFERMKMIKYDNMYMSTTEDYNGNFYEFYCNYEDVPTNIHLDSGERFSTLLRRSLPLTKKGLLYMDILEELGNSANFSTSLELYGSNLLIKDDNINQTSKTINNSLSYYEEVDNRLLKKNEDYELSLLFDMSSIQNDLNELAKPFNFYDSSNWKKTEGNNPTFTQDSISITAVTGVLLNKEFTQNTKYTLSFNFKTASNRQGLYLFGNRSGNKLYGIVTDVGNTFIEEYDNNGNATRIHDCSKNYFGSGTHSIKIDRDDTSADLYVDNELIYTFTGLQDTQNIFGMWKWSSNSLTISDIVLSTSTEDVLMSVEIEFKDQNNNETSNIILDDRIYSDTKTHISYDFTTPPSDWEKMFIRIQSDVETELEEITLKTKNKLL